MAMRAARDGFCCDAAEIATQNEGLTLRCSMIVSFDCGKKGLIMICMGEMTNLKEALPMSAKQPTRRIDLMHEWLVCGRLELLLPLLLSGTLSLDVPPGLGRKRSTR